MSAQKTNDYNLFSLKNNNRPICKKHVDLLAKKIYEKNHTKDCPILVNKNYEIIDGQHRFEACKKLNLPIYFIMTFEEDDDRLMIEMNVVKKTWVINDYINFYASKGIESYVKIDNLSKKENIPIFEILRCKNWDCGLSFCQLRDGTFHAKINEEEITEKIKFHHEILEFINTYLFIPSPRNWLTTRKFIKSLYCLYSKEGFDIEILKKGLTKQSNKLSVSATIKEYIFKLTNIYNSATKNAKLSVDQEYTHENN